jgi:PAT family beta-lactamase induction signal transducer AmpG
LLWTTTTYFGEGMPWSFLHQMATEFLTSIKASSSQVGATSVFHLAVTLKFLWSPLVDLFGRKRTWLWVMQLILGAGMLGVAAVVTTRNMTLFWAVMGVLSILHATHDIACDGFYLQALDQKERALYSGVRVAGFRLAMFVGSSVLVTLFGDTSWPTAFAIAGGLMLLVGLLNRSVMPHPPEHHPQEYVQAKAPGHGHESGRAYVEAFRTFFTQPNAVLVLSFLFLFRVGDIMMFAMSRPMLRDIGLDAHHRGILNGVSMWMAVAGALAGGALIARQGLRRWLVPMTYLQNLSIPLYVGLAVFKPSFAGVVPVVAYEQFVAGVGTAAYSVFQMQRCRTAFSASHFAFLTALVALASTISGLVSGPLNERLGHAWFFAIAFFASIPSLVLVWIVPKDPIEAPPAPTTT